jgi:two-component system response regulator
VDDSSSDVELTKRALSKSQIDTNLDVVEDGSDALDYLFCRGAYSSRNPRSKPDLILLDLNIPKIDGNEVLKRIRQNQNTKHIPVVVMTSSNEERDLLAAYNNGANSYVRKPLEFARFVEVVSLLGHYWLEINELPRD